MRQCYPIAASTAPCRPPSDSPPYAGPPTLRPCNPVAPRAHAARADSGRAARADLQRVERLLGAQDRAHGELLHPDRRALDHDLPRPRPHLDPREQHRADDRIGQRLRCGRRRLHDPGHPPDGIRPGNRSGGDSGDGRRADGGADDDPPAPRVDREGARHPDLPGGHGLRGSADRRRRARPPGQARLPGVRRGLRLQVSPSGAQGLAGRSGQGARLLPRRRGFHGDVPRAPGRGVHHRPAHRRLLVRRRLLRLPGARPRDQARGIGPHRAVRVPGGEADPRHEPRGAPVQLRVLHRGGCRGLGPHPRAGPLAAGDPEPLRLQPQRPARLEAGPCGAPAGARGPALVVGWTLTLLNRAYTYPIPETHAASSAQALAPAAGGRAPVEILPETVSGFRIAGSDSVDRASYQVVRVYVVTEGVAAGKYLMDPTTHELRYVLDPGIGGRVHDYRGKPIPRPDSPKATIMALITDGILTHKLPWALVLLGVFITIAIELMGVQALPVAVGVYLPISTSSAMFVGGVVRWLIERRAKAAQQSIAEIESGPGVLFSSGLIAGGAICGIVLAAIAGVFGSADALAERVPVSQTLGGLAHSNVLAYGLFGLLGALLYRIGLREQ